MLALASGLRWKYHFTRGETWLQQRCLDFLQGNNFCPFIFPLATGSPVMSGYYGVRRSLLTDSDFHNSKQFTNDACTRTVAKDIACESSAAQGHPAHLDSYFPELYGDHRPTALTPNSDSLISASPLPQLLPLPFPSEPAHFVLVSMQRLSLGCR